MNYADLNYLDSEIDGMTNICGEPAEKYYSEKDYPYQKEIYNIVGACMEVHRELGYGFKESVYHEALCMELTSRGIPFESDKLLYVYYKGTILKQRFEADIYAYGHIIVELKAIFGSMDPHVGQLINYMSTTKHELGLMVNFGLPSLQWKRFIISKNRRSN